VLSFSDGHIRTSLIREKLGLVGLDKLNELAECCAQGNLAESLSLLDEILSSGVAIETFITDLAAYFHSLLLLKAGVSRESILGYPPERFSQKVLETYDTTRLARAGELLYALYRDIRFSVSPRFELETLVSKLCWLEKWISHAELGEAVAKAQRLLGTNRPLAASLNANIIEQGEVQPGSLAEEFKRHMADKANNQKNPQAISKGQDEKASVNTDPGNLDPGVKKVLQVFRGSIVENYAANCDADARGEKSE
jgi:DNA polymerase-3 subunit gamma/tau